MFIVISFLPVHIHTHADTLTHTCIPKRRERVKEEEGWLLLISRSSFSFIFKRATIIECSFYYLIIMKQFWLLLLLYLSKPSSKIIKFKKKPTLLVSPLHFEETNLLFKCIGNAS